MELKAVRIQNFLSVEDAVVDYTGKGTTLVVGENGVGKSALFVEPLLWQWYDMLNRSDKKPKMSGVRRRYRMQPVDEPTSVETWFSNNGHEYYVKRTLQGGWEVSRDGSSVTPYKTKADGVASMQQAIGLPSHLFRAIAVMGQGFGNRFTAFKDSDRTAVIEDFLGAAAYEQGQAEAKDSVTAVENALRSLTATRESAEQSLATTEAQIASAEQERQQLAANLSQTRQALEQESEQLGVERGQKVDEQQRLQQAYTQAEDGIATWKLNEQRSRDAASHQQSVLASLSTTAQMIVDTRNRLVGLGDKCPTCFQVVNQDIVAAEVQSLDQQWADVEAQRSAAEQKLVEAQDNVAEAQSCLQWFQTESRTQNQMINEAGNRIRDIDNRFEIIQRDLSNAGDAEIIADRNLSQLRDRLETERANLVAAQQAEAEYQARRPYLSWWGEHFSIRGIRSKRLGGVIEAMNGNLVDYCQQLFDGQIMVRLLPVKPQKTSSDKSAVSVQVTGPSGSYEMASGGQQRCIDLAIHFSLRRFAQTAAFGWASNFLIGDEVFDHLHRSLAERALGILKQEADRVFLITQSPELQSLCDSTWHVRYEDEKTTL